MAVLLVYSPGNLNDILSHMKIKIYQVYHTVYEYSILEHQGIEIFQL